MYINKICQVMYRRTHKFSKAMRPGGTNNKHKHETKIFLHSHDADPTLSDIKNWFYFINIIPWRYAEMAHVVEIIINGR